MDELENTGDPEDAKDLDDADDASVAVGRGVAIVLEAGLR